jgi:hypothetical protein
VTDGVGNVGNKDNVGYMLATLSQRWQQLIDASNSSLATASATARQCWQHVGNSSLATARWQHVSNVANAICCQRHLLPTTSVANAICLLPMTRQRYSYHAIYPLWTITT